MKSHYQALINSDVPNIHKRLWKLKALLKLKVFLWYLRRGVVLTKDKLAKCNWQGNKMCCFCHRSETIRYLFFECRLALSVFVTGNEIYMVGRRITSLMVAQDARN